MCVSFSQSFPKGLATHLATPLNPSDDAKVRSLEWHLDDRYANKFAPLDSTAIYPKSGHKLLYTPMTGEMKCPRLYLCLAHSIPEGYAGSHGLGSGKP